MPKWRYGKIRKYTQGQATRNWQSKDAKAGRLALDFKRRNAPHAPRTASCQESLTGLHTQLVLRDWSPGPGRQPRPKGSARACVPL